MNRLEYTHALRELARIEATRAPVVSVYADLRDRDMTHELRRLLQRSCEALEPDRRALAEEPIDRVARHLDASSTPVRADVVFARSGTDRERLFRTFELKVPVRTQVFVSELPHLFPMVDLQARYGEFLIVVASEEDESARILDVHLGEVVQDLLSRPAPTDETRRRRPPLSQKRSRRRRAVDDELTLLSRLKQETDEATPVVLAGGSTVVQYLRRRLPEDLRKNAVSIDTNDHGTLHELIESAARSAEEARRRHARAEVRAVRRSLEDDGDAASGVEAVKEALVTGDAERLLLDRDHPSREELVRLALRHDVPIELLDGELEDLDGVCCRLRHRPLEY